MKSAHILLVFVLVITLPTLHYNHCQFLLKEHELEIDEQRSAAPVRSIFDLGVPPMPDHIPEPEPQASTI